MNQEADQTSGIRQAHAAPPSTNSGREPVERSLPKGGGAEIVPMGERGLVRAASSLVARGLKEIARISDDVNAADKDGWTPLRRAAAIGHKDVAELLIAKGANVNAETNDGWTPLHEAALNGHKDVAGLLLAKGANVNAAEKDDWCTPLHCVAYTGHAEATEVVDLLIAKGANVNAKGKDGRTPLHLAAGKGHKDVAELLIAKRANVNAATKKGSTPLHYAAQEGHKDVAELLLANEADVNAATKEGFTPLHLATAEGHQDVVELLRRYGARR